MDSQSFQFETGESERAGGREAREKHKKRQKRGKGGKEREETKT